MRGGEDRETVLPGSPPVHYLQAVVPVVTLFLAGC
jgi:hypothetical protein